MPASLEALVLVCAGGRRKGEPSLHATRCRNEGGKRRQGDRAASTVAVSLVWRNRL